MKRPWLAVGALALVAVAAVVWWVWARSTPSVETETARIEEVAELVRGPGVVDARVIASVGSRITGIVAEVLVDVGDRVEGGAPLARLEDSQLHARLAAARAAASA
ncbi:MAG: efflux RND transporter periplasmic adaptor subunit, partial [Thermoanaerobaculia bacterium]|nr:efflux RND transporter periplasmic adaptor subunit [Thermoanaerobaculia bacterium]